eukprot:8435379-Heterocapsa_arctica.AAC.1
MYRKFLWTVRVLRYLRRQYTSPATRQEERPYERGSSGHQALIKRCPSGHYVPGKVGLELQANTSIQAELGWNYKQGHHLRL